MNKSLLYGICAAILLFGTYFFINRVVSEVSFVTYYAGLGSGILVGIIAFVKGIGEIRRKESRLQGVLGMVLGFVSGILPLLVLLVGMILILVSGGH